MNDTAKNRRVHIIREEINDYIKGSDMGENKAKVLLEELYSLLTPKELIYELEKKASEIYTDAEDNKNITEYWINGYISSFENIINTIQKEDIINTSKFYLANNHTFEEIKKSNIEDLDYEKAYDLAVIENKEYNISTYLGVYESNYYLTFSVHSSKSYDIYFENTLTQKLDITKINSKEELEENMKKALSEFYNKAKVGIEKRIEELDEEATKSGETTEDEEEPEM